MKINKKREFFGVEQLEVYVDGLIRDYAIITDSNNKSASRMVWFVAIAGFAFINIFSFAKSVLGKDPCPIQQLLLALPWALTAMFGIVSNWLIGEMIERDNNFHILKMHAIQSYIANIVKEPTVDEVLEIINVDDTDEEVSTKKKAVDKLYPWVIWTYRFTFIFLLLSFIWSSIYLLLNI